MTVKEFIEKLSKLEQDNDIEIIFVGPDFNATAELEELEIDSENNCYEIIFS